jgi:hypothetical protein
MRGESHDYSPRHVSTNKKHQLECRDAGRAMTEKKTAGQLYMGDYSSSSRRETKMTLKSLLNEQYIDLFPDGIVVDRLTAFSDCEVVLILYRLIIVDTRSMKCISIHRS